MAVDSDTIDETQQQALLEKYDPEAGSRKLGTVFKWILFFGLLAFSLFQLVYTIWGNALNIGINQLRPIHLGFALALVFILFPARRKQRSVRYTFKKFDLWTAIIVALVVCAATFVFGFPAQMGLSSVWTGVVVIAVIALFTLFSSKLAMPWYDLMLCALSIGVTAYWPLRMDYIVGLAGSITMLEVVVGVLAIVLVLEAARRVVGLPIAIISIVFLLYALFGEIMPDMLAHKNFSLERIARTMFFTNEGILGTPLGVSADYIFLFLLFGAFLMKTGIGQYFNDLASVIAGRAIGGPAKVAIFSSALQGTISGSSVSNVVASGSFTIPMMKKLGYNKNFAGAVEAAASTGGQIMPPIMGAAAFLMVEYTGLPYWQIAAAATIPALLYFTGVWIMTHFEAKRMGLRGLSDAEMPNKKEVLKKIYLLLPLVAVIGFLSLGMSVPTSALYAIVVAIVVSMFRKDTRMSVVDFIDALVSGARSALGVAIATACAGIVVGVITSTGLGLSLGNSLISLAGGYLLPTLFLTMIASIILGMGSPTTANYVITSTIAAPALLMLGVPLLASHMFVFYFGIVADITPPVALAAFAAAGVSGGSPIKTGLNATKLAIGAFIIPYMFVLSPSLILIDTTWYWTLWSVITAFCGMMAIGGALVGHWYRHLSWYERVLAGITGLCLVYPEGFTDIVGVVLFVGMIVLQKVFKGKDMGTGAGASGRMLEA
jgi:TRAP transporter 4TM/12TM fusion protein